MTTGTPEEIKAHRHSEAVKGMGREPINPIGKCFESTGHLALYDKAIPNNITICHGIGVATMPGEEGTLIKHAWIEDDKGWAYDTTWGLKTKAADYKKKLKIRYMVRYKFREFVLLVHQHNNAGPFDEKIKAIGENNETEILP
jgi:hypothetical protein